MTRPAYKDGRDLGAECDFSAQGSKCCGEEWRFGNAVILSSGCLHGQHSLQKQTWMIGRLEVTDASQAPRKSSELFSVPPFYRGLASPLGIVTLAGLLWAPWGQDLCGSRCYCPRPSTQVIPGQGSAELRTEPDFLSLSLGSEISQPLHKWLCLSVSQFPHW